MSDYVFETDTYGVKVMEKLVPQAGTGFYGVEHKETGVIEVSNPQLPVAIEACNHLTDKLTEARMSFLAKPG